MEVQNEAAVKFALKKGFVIVARRDPENHTIRIKTQPDPQFDLTNLYKKIIKIDPKATWFLHASKNMLLNGSSKNMKHTATPLSLQTIIELLQQKGTHVA